MSIASNYKSPSMPRRTCVGVSGGRAIASTWCPPVLQVKYFSSDETITKGHRSHGSFGAGPIAGYGRIAPRKIGLLLDETAQAVWEQARTRVTRLVDSTPSVVVASKTNIGDVNDTIENSGPIFGQPGQHG